MKTMKNLLIVALIAATSAAAANDIKINLQRLNTNFKGEVCFVTPRAAIRPDGTGIMTTGLLDLYGDDVDLGIHILETADKGKTWSAIRPSKTLTQQKLPNGYHISFGDANPVYHKKSGKILLLGHSAIYDKTGRKLAPPPRPRFTVWTVYDEKTKEFKPLRYLKMKNETEYFSCGSGGGAQCHELENGDLLIPVYYRSLEAAKDPWRTSYNVTIMRCSFDGRELKFIECGNSVSIPTGRGLCEPSLIKFKDKFFIALRNDAKGYVASSKDGINIDKPKVLIFDDGKESGNYCTQQHWLIVNNKLYMVYTRKGANNDHVMRHRAPLFIAEFDTGKMCLIRSTEKIAVPERGARLGNFGCINISPTEAWVTAAEWMQSWGPNRSDWKSCMKYGSDNSIFISKITAE